MSDLISVIVPVYNVEKYLPKCLDSIVNQTYQNLEIILVDDGSTDKSGQICDEYAKKDSRIKVIYKKNGGLSDARNAGLDICTGEYIGFVDSDDWIELDMYKKLYTFAVDNKLDIAMCGVNAVLPNKMRRPILGKRFITESKEEIIKSTLVGVDTGGGIFACNKLYLRKRFYDMKYAVGKAFEDNYILPYFYEKTKRFGYISDGLYNYYQRDNSIVNPQKFNRQIFDLIEATDKLFEHIKSYYPLALNYAWGRWVNARRQAIETVYNCVDGNEHKKEIKQWQRELRNNFWEIMSLKGYRVKAKVAYVLILLNVDLYMWVKGMMGK